MYLGIDLGTSEVKALLIDGRQNVPPPVLHTVAPEASWRDAMAPRYARFRALYTQLKPLF